MEACSVPTTMQWNLRTNWTPSQLSTSQMLEFTDVLLSIHFCSETDNLFIMDIMARGC